MKDRPRIQRALLRRALRKQMQHENPECMLAIQLALDDESIFETVYETSMQQAQCFAETTEAFSITTSSDGQPMVDNLLKLLQWFITNGPLLVEVIQQIIGLFGSVDLATELCEDETMFID